MPLKEECDIELKEIWWKKRNGKREKERQRVGGKISFLSTDKVKNLCAKGEKDEYIERKIENKTDREKEVRDLFYLVHRQRWG